MMNELKDEVERWQMKKTSLDIRVKNLTWNSVKLDGLRGN